MRADGGVVCVDWGSVGTDLPGIEDCVVWIEDKLWEEGRKGEGKGSLHWRRDVWAVWRPSTNLCMAVLRVS